MGKLIARVVIWGLCVTMTFFLGWLLYVKLYSQRYPREVLATTYLEKRLGDLTSDQAGKIKTAVDYDPVLAMLAVDMAQARNQSPWTAIDSVQHEPSGELVVGRLALLAGMAGKLKKDDAANFVESTLGLWSILNQADPTEADKFLDQIKQCSPDEYINVAADSSYTLIITRLDPKYREEFRRNQRVLTPLLATADVKDWNRLLAAFQTAQPRVGEILASPQLGRPYGLIYMLELDLIQALEKTGIAEKDAIEFVGPNAATIHEFKGRQPDWTLYVSRLEKNMAPSGKKTLFRVACSDPAVFWLVAHDHDRSEETSRSLQILRRYAETELPAILMKYGQNGQNPKALDSAMDALVRFDNEHDPEPKHRQSGAKLLSKFQDNEGFKDLLARHGPVLIAALFTGPTDALAQIQKNPNDITKWVDENGKPKGTPLWTYVPGGNIAYAVKEKINGRTLTWGELGWATFDAVLLVPVVGEGGVAVKALLNGEKVAGDGLVKAAAENATKETEEIVITESAKTAVELVVKQVPAAAKVGAELESRSLLRGLGVTLASGFEDVTKFVVQTATKYPGRTSAAALSVLYGASKNFREWIHNELRDVEQAIGANAVGIPVNTLKGAWDEIQAQIQKTPMLASLYYILLFSIIVGVVWLDFFLLKKLLRPIYDFAVAPLWSFLRRTWAILRRKQEHVPTVRTT